MSDKPGSKNKKRMEDWKNRRDKIMQMGGPAAVEKTSQKGTYDGQGKGGISV